MDDLRNHLQRRMSQLRTERASYFDHWKDLSDYVSPRTSRFLVTDRQKQGYTRNTKIYDNTGTLALRTLASGMMSGITSPARPWFQLRTPDPGLNEVSSVKEYLDLARRLIMEIFLKSNLYTVLPAVYADLGLYGTAAFAVLEDEETVVRCMGFPIGSYFLGCSHRGVVDSLFREYQMTAGQLVGEFGKENCSTGVATAMERGAHDSWFNVTFAIEPNTEWDDSKLDSKFKRFRSVYYESQNREKLFLSERGFDEFPICAPRWQTVGEDTYGISPGMEALSDIRMLQQEQKRKLQAIDKKVTPPITAPVALKNQPISLLSGGVTFSDDQSGRESVRATYQVNLNLNELQQDIAETQDRIRRTFFADLFMMISNIERSGTTAYEIARKEEEKLLALGPVYLKLNDELLDPLIERTFSILLRSGHLPPAPKELQGKAINVEYISIIAQTMKAVGVTGIERVMTFAGNLGQAFPGVLDVLDPDEAITSYADMLGTPPKMIRDAQAVKGIRDARAKQQAAAQNMALAEQGAKAANQLANAPLSDNNALAQLMQRMQGAGQGAA